MIEISSFCLGLLTAISSGVVTLYVIFRRYRKITFSLNLDRLKESGYYLLEALEDMKLSEEEKLAILNKLRDAITEETRVVRINADEIKEVEPDEIITAIKSVYPTAQVKAISDSKYYTVSKRKWEEIIRNDFLEQKRYLTERFDCDDFSRCFVARVIENYGLNACGVVWGKMTKGAYHAWNFIYTAEGQLFWFEPQRESLFLPSGKEYEAQDIFM